MPDDFMTDTATLPTSLRLRHKLLDLLADGPAGILRRLMRQPTLRATAVFALSGLAFAVGNLLLARTMPMGAFGHFALAIALFNVFGLLAPLGLDQAMLRHRIDPGPKLLLFLSLSGLLMGGVVGMGFTHFYGLNALDGWALALVIAAGGVTAALVALARSRQFEAASLLLVTAASWILLLVGALSLIIPMQSALLPLVLFALGNLFAASYGWWVMGSHRVPPEERSPIPWSEAFSLLGIAAIGTAVLQLERLVIPLTIGIHALALFSVLASVAIFPFRLLTASAGFALVPKLRAAKSRLEKVRLIRHELLAVSALLVVSTICIVALVPYATTWLTDGHYEIGFGLALAACFNGCGKVMQSFPRALITACGDDRDIARLNRLGWIGLLTSIAGAFAGAPFGLTGLLYGITLGSMVGTLPAILMARRKLK